MATINTFGFETRSAGAAIEAAVVSGSPGINTTDPRTGAACLEISAASGAAELIRVGERDANGRAAAFSRTAETFYTFYFRFVSIPTVNSDFASVVTSGGANVVVVNVTTAGAVRLIGATTSATIATVSTGIWYRMDLRVTSNATSGGKIDGGSEQTCTAQNVTQGLLQFGRSGTTATVLAVLFDDVMISDSGFPAAGSFKVAALYPVGAGATAGWTNGTGNTFAEIDDWATGAHDSDTTNISASATDDNLSSDFDMTTCATAGVNGTIVSVVGVAAMKTDSVTGTSAAGALMRAADGTEYIVATPLELTTPYTARSVGPYDTDPETGAAWTTSGLDATTFGVKAGTLAQVQRCTALLVYVAYTPPTVTQATPDPVAIELATVAPAPSLAHTATPTALRLTTVAPGVKTAHAATPVSLLVSTVAPTPTIVATPAAVSLLATVPAPAVSLLVAESPVALELTVGEETPRLLIQRVPDPVEIELVTVAPTVSLVAAQDPVALELATVAPTVTRIVAVDPVALELSTVAAAAALASLQPATAIELSTVAPTVLVAVAGQPVALAVTVPAPSVTLAVTAAPVALVLTVPAPVIEAESTIVSPDPVVLEVTAPAPSLSLAVAVAPVQARLTVPAPSVALVATGAPVALALAAVAPAVALQASPAAVALRVLTVAPTIGAFVVTPAPVALRLTVPAPDAISAQLTPRVLRASYTPKISRAARYGPLVLQARGAAALRLRAQYIIEAPSRAEYEPTVELAGRF